MPQRFDTAIPSNRAKLDAVEQLAKVADEAGLTMIQLALGFVTAHPAVTSAIIGPRTLDHLHSQLAAADTVLSADVLDAIDAIVAPGIDLAAAREVRHPARPARPVTAAPPPLLRPVGGTRLHPSRPGGAGPRLVCSVAARAADATPDARRGHPPLHPSRPGSRAAARVLGRGPRRRPQAPSRRVHPRPGRGVEPHRAPGVSPFPQPAPRAG